jgi:hypothetical protein
MVLELTINCVFQKGQQREIWMFPTERINIWDDGYANYLHLIIIHCINILKYYNVYCKYAQLSFKNFLKRPLTYL